MIHAPSAINHKPYSSPLHAGPVAPWVAAQQGPLTCGAELLVAGPEGPSYLLLCCTSEGRLWRQPLGQRS